MGKKRRKMNKAQKRACVLPEINRPKNRKPKQRPNPLFFCEKRHFEIDSMIAKGTAIFVGEHQCVSQEIKVINFDGILINDNGENISVPLKRCIMCGKTIIQPDIMKGICKNNSFSLYHFMGAHHGEEFNKTNGIVQIAIGDSNFNSHLFRFPGGYVGGKYADIKKQA